MAPDDFLEDEDLEESEGGDQGGGGLPIWLSRALIYLALALGLILIMILTSAVVFSLRESEDTEIRSIKKPLVRDVPPPTETLLLPELRINLDDNDNTGTISVTCVIALAFDRGENKVHAELTKRQTQIIDVVNTIIAKKKYTDINTVNKREQTLKKELKHELNNLLTIPGIRDVYFSKFIIQKL